MSCWGLHEDTPVPGDFDGDGINDFAVWRRYQKTVYRGPIATWIVRRSSDGSTLELTWGATSGDVAAAADYDGDGQTDPGVMRPATGEWLTFLSGGGGFTTMSYSPSGINPVFEWRGVLDHWSYFPAPADYDGDGTANLGYFRPATARWIWQGNDVEVDFGLASGAFDPHWDVAVPADYDGDGVAELAVWRSATTQWVSENGSIDLLLGEPLDVPVPGDYDGDGLVDPAVFGRTPRPSYQYLAGNLTQNHVGYDYQVDAFLDDDGTYRLFWCGRSPTGRLDAIWYAQSSAAAGPYSTPALIDDGGCAVTALKIPGSANNRCAGNPVYFLFYESDNHSYVVDRNGNVVSSTPELDGNKILAKVTCNANDPQSWTTLGRVLAPISPPAPDPGSIPYGKGHPSALMLDGVVYLTFYHDGVGDGNNATHLATSVDGEAFVEHGRVGYTVGTLVSYVAPLDLFVGTANHDIEGHGPSIFAARDIGGMDYFLELNHYARSQTLLSSPIAHECGWRGTLLTNPQGIITTLSTLLYGGEWDTGPAGICWSQVDPDFSIDGSELYVISVELHP